MTEQERHLGRRWFELVWNQRAACGDNAGERGRDGICARGHSERVPRWFAPSVAGSPQNSGRKTFDWWRRGAHAATELIHSKRRGRGRIERRSRIENIVAFADFRSAVLRIPRVDRRVTDAHFPSQFRHSAPCFVLLQHADNLLFSEPPLLRLWIPFFGVVFTSPIFEILNFNR